MSTTISAVSSGTTVMGSGRAAIWTVRGIGGLLGGMGHGKQRACHSASRQQPPHHAGQPVDLPVLQPAAAASPVAESRYSAFGPCGPTASASTRACAASGSGPVWSACAASAMKVSARTGLPCGSGTTVTHSAR